MKGKFECAFDCIRAEDDLKKNTLIFLQKELQKKGKLHIRPSIINITYATICLAFIFFTGLFSYNLYFTKSAYIDLDINPSIELSINRFDRVIDIYSYNSEGKEILANINIKHKNYNDAVEMILESAVMKNLLQNSALVSVTLQTGHKERESKLLSSIKTKTETFIHGHHYSTQINVFTVNRDIRTHSHELNISPAKYIAIVTLQEVDPNATFESCKSHTINEINNMTHSHTDSKTNNLPTHRTDANKKNHNHHSNGYH